LTERRNDNALFESWLKGIRNLTSPEIAVSRNPDSLAPWNSFTFDKVGDFKAVAHEVQLIDRGSLWVEKQEPSKRRDFDYPGFASFEPSPLEEHL
jgi:hypothetical protein